jgi:hypothetical protein
LILGKTWSWTSKLRVEHADKQMRLVTTLLSAVLIGCDAPPTAPSSSPPPPPSPFAKIAGDYALTIELLDGTCTGFPHALRVRLYDAKVLDPSHSHSYAKARVSGGGFSEPVDIGWFYPLVPPGNSHFRFEWNTNDDASGFDYAEPLPDSSELVFSAKGSVTLIESTISGTLQGGAFVLKDGVRVANCGGSHRVTFVRRAG